MKRKSLICGALAAAVIAGSLPAAAQGYTVSDEDFYYRDIKNYSEYTAFKADNATEEVSIDALAFSPASSLVRGEEIGGKRAAVISEGGKLELSFEVKKSGYYNLEFGYYPISGSSSPIKAELYLDNEIPFAGASTLTFRRVWKENKEYEEDSQGNQIRASANDNPEWCSKLAEDSSGMTGEAYRFYLEAGSHNLSLNVYQNSLALSLIKLIPPESVLSYSEAKAQYPDNGNSAQKQIRLEAESADIKSDRSIVVLSDKTSPQVSPSSAARIRYNSMGGDSWKTVGEWIEWKVNIPQSGIYNLSVHYKQDTKSGDVSFRKLYIDGSVPFKEAEALSFGYSDWKNLTLGDKNGNYEFYLTEGEHTLRLEVTLGNFAKHLSAVNDALERLNKVYTDIVMVTGPTPDTDRDYRFEKAIPDVIEEMKALSGELKSIEGGLEKFIGETGGQSTAAISRLYTALDKMVKNPETISKRLGNYIADVTSLATWCNDSRSQPLQLDYITLSAADSKIKEKGGNIFKGIAYHFKQFVYSFITDYANVGNKAVDTDVELRVWIGTGRDQADIIRSLINESFTSKSNIGANVQLVNLGALLPATLAKIGPDVYLSISEEQPVDYALRHAVTDLSEFEDCEEVLSRFYQNALSSFYLDDGLYALPETMTYPMLFYRKDILTRLGINKDDLTTWDGILQKVLPELDMNYFDFGIQSTIKTYANLLYQNGGRLYTKDSKASALSSAEAIASFEQMTSMFTDYGLPKAFDFANRFRSGQMPLAIVDYTSYNQLSIFAPEIDGLWEMLPIPGVIDSEGILNRTAVCTVTGAVMLSDSKYKNESWEFLKWWTSADIQSRYALELESVMGTGARYAAANIEAMQAVEWSKATKAALSEQLGSVMGMPYIAGSYYTTRSFDFAFRDVVYNGENLRETLGEAAENITGEITDKRNEFYNKEGRK